MDQKEGPGRNLAKRHAFGIKPDVHGCLNWVEDGTLMYPVGKTVALHNLNTNTQRFFDVGARSSGLTALAVSANKKFIAIAEGGTAPQIQIIDSVTRKRRKVLTLPDFGSDRFISLDFSVDGRHLVTQSGAPEWKLFFWNWERSKPLAYASVVGDLSSDEVMQPNLAFTAFGGRVKDPHNTPSVVQPVSCVTISPKDPLLIGVSGLGMMRFYRYMDGVLQTQSAIGYSLERSANFVTHTWITNERVVAATQTGELLLIEGGTHRRMLPAPPALISRTDNPVVLTIAPSKGGFVAGSDHGTVAIYKVDALAGDEYAIVYNVRVPLEDIGLSKSNPTEGGAMQHGASTIAAPNAASAGPAAPLGPSENTSSNPPLKGAKPIFQVGTATSPRATIATTTTTTAAASTTTTTTTTTTTAAAAAAQEAQMQSMRSDVGRASLLRENSVVRLALNNREDTMVLVTHAGKIFAFNFSEQWSERSIDDPPNLVHICQSFHVGGIVGVDCSVRRPFLITSGVDRSVRIWNTSTQQLEMCQYFTSPPGPVAIHPNGLYVVICFPDKVIVMTILWNCLHEHRVLNLRNVIDVKFSLGGKYFALAHGNLIHVYNSLTCDLHGQLRGHPQKINCFQWCSTSAYPTDNGMISCSLDGLIITWNMSEMRKETEHVDKRYQYKFVTADNRNIWCVGEPASVIAEAQWKSTLREMDRFGSTDIGGNLVATDYEFRDNAFTTLVVAPKQRLLFGGMDDGSIKFMTFPLQVGVQELPVVAHMGKVARMVLSYDETTLYTISTDGTLFIFDVREDGRTTHPDTSYYGDEVLVLASDVEERDVAIESLKQMVDRLKTEIQGEEKRRTHEQNTRVRERVDEFKGELDALDMEYTALWNAKAEQERAFIAIKMEKEAEAAPILAELECKGQEEVQQLDDLCTELQYRLDGGKELFAQEVNDVLEGIERKRREDAERFNDIVVKREEGLVKLEQQLQRMKESNAESRRHLELDTQIEITGVRQQIQRELDAIRERYLHMKGESAIMRKNALRMEKEAEVHTNELLTLDSAKAALTTKLGELNQRMAQLHQDIDERDSIIGEKEKKIYDLKKLNQELEKHKFVLDYRIRQLKSQMEPRQREIAREHQRINEKNLELENIHQNNIALRQNIEELKADLAQQQAQIKQTLNHMKDFETYKSRVKTDVGELAPAMQDPAQLREVVERLYQRHVVVRDGHRATQVDPEIKVEFSSQLEYLSTSVEALRRKFKADQEQHRTEVSTMMAENLSLIREIHELRTELGDLRNVSVAVTDEAQRRHRAERANKSGGPSLSGYTTSLTTMMAASKRPEMPREFEENRAEIQQLRALVDAMQKALGGDALRPSSGTVPLPPIV